MTAPHRPLSDLGAAMARQPMRITTNERLFESDPTIGPGSRREWIDTAVPLIHRSARWRIEGGELQHRWLDSATTSWRTTTGVALAERVRERRLAPEGVRVPPERWEAVVDEVRAACEADQAYADRLAATPRMGLAEALARRVRRSRRVWLDAEGAPRWETWVDWQQRQVGGPVTQPPVRTSNRRLAALLAGPAPRLAEPGEALTLAVLGAYMRVSGVAQPDELVDDRVVVELLDLLIAGAEPAPTTT